MDARVNKNFSANDVLRCRPKKLSLIKASEIAVYFVFEAVTLHSVVERVLFHPQDRGFESTRSLVNQEGLAGNWDECLLSMRSPTFLLCVFSDTSKQVPVYLQK